MTPEARHDAAMDLADEADALIRLGRAGEAWPLLRQAAAECERAGLEIGVEPSRSVMLRSAAWLYLQGRDMRAAERAAALGIAAQPPPEILDELRDVLEQAYFERHLDLRGVELDDAEFQLSIHGDEVGLGIARSDAFMSRVVAMTRLIHRTSDRLSARSFGQSHRSELDVYVSTPRAASFAVTLRVAYPKDACLEQQSMLPADAPTGKPSPSVIVSDVMECFALLSAGDDQAVAGRFDNDDYYRNFVALARQVAPDGRSVTQVGLTSEQGVGPTSRVAMRRRSKAIAQVPRADEQAAGEEPHRVRGVLHFADGLKTGGRRFHKIALEGQSEPIEIRVEQALMQDIVKPLWGETVEATFVVRDRKNWLRSIERVD